MRQSIKFITLKLVILLAILPSFSAIQGGIDYSIPIDYSKMNQSELKIKAEYYYNLAISTNNLNENTTSALNLYRILTNIEPNNIEYALHLGKLYDVIGKDRYAKAQYYRAISTDKTNPEPYYYLAEYLYSREQYRKALKNYKRAYDCGYSNNTETINRINDIQKKFGSKENFIQVNE